MIKARQILFMIFILISYSTVAAQINKVVANSADEICPIMVGQTIPEVNLKNVDGESVALSKLISEKPTVLIIYRGGWCPYCNSHLSELYDAEKSLAELGYQILAVSMDRPEKLKETLGETKINYTLLSDSEANAVKKFGLAFRVDDELNKKYIGYGINLEDASGEDHHILPVPAAFVLNTEGVIQFSYVNPDYKTRLSSVLLIAAAKIALK